MFSHTMFLESLEKPVVNFVDIENMEFDKNEHRNKNHRARDLLQKHTVMFNDKISQTVQQ